MALVRTKRNSKKSNNNLNRPSSLNIKEIKPLTNNQKLTFEKYYNGKNLLLLGFPGTGKSFISLFLALEDVMSKDSNFKKVVIIRSGQSGKNIGFLPGSAQQKMEVFETPYINICNNLFNRGDAYSILKQKNTIEFESTSFLRGTTIDNAIIIIDESQNFSYQELKTTLTRTGENTRIIVCGDINQDDLTSIRFNEESGLKKMIPILNKIETISSIEFGIEDIVRSGFVRDFIVAELYNS